MHDTIKALLEKRANIVEQARDLYERAEKEGRALSGEAETTWTAHMEEVRQIDARVKELRELVAGDAAAAEFRSELDELARKGGAAPESRGAEDAEEFRKFFAGESGQSRMFEFNAATLEARAATGQGHFTAGTDGEPNLIADTFVRTLYEALRETSIVRELAQQIVTAGGEKMIFPRITGRPSASRVDEGNAIGKSKAQFSKAELESYKYAFIAMLTSEMTTDPAVNIVPFLVVAGQEAVGEAQAEDFMVGDGTNGPLGIFPGASLVVNGAGVGALTFDELLALKFKVKPKYRRNGLYVVNDTSVLALAKIKDGDGNYAWKTSTREGEPDTIHGKRVAVDPFAPEIGAGNRSVAFVDPARAYLIRDVGELRVDRSTEYGFDTDEIAWRFIARADGGVWDANALAVIAHPAS